MNEDKQFPILVRLPDQENASHFTVGHYDETFNIAFKGQGISLINNGDNSWSQVKGNLSQEAVNLIGEAIEQYFQQSTK